MAGNTSFSVELNSLGPFFDNKCIDYTDCELNSKKLIFYADNGTGKTTISRLLQITNSPQRLSDHIISKNNLKGTFKFKLDLFDVSLALEKGKPPVIQNKGGSIFHVFNSDYVNEQIAKNDFGYASNTSGYILGKSQIDLTQDKNNLLLKQEKRDQLKEDISKKINQARQQLKNEGVNQNTLELKQFIFESFLKNQKNEEKENYSTLVPQYRKLKEKSSFDNKGVMKKIELEDYSEVEELLIKQYEKSDFDESFVERMKRNHDFIEKGIDLYKSDPGVCPFCQRSIEDAADVVKEYLKYLDNEEHKLVKKLDAYFSKLVMLKEKIGRIISDYSVCKSLFEKDIENFDSLKNNVVVPLPDCSKLFEALDLIISKINLKKNDIVKEIDCKNEFTVLKNEIEVINECIGTYNSFVGALEKEISNKDRVELDKRKRLCNSLFNQVLDDLSQDIDSYNNCCVEIEELNNTIKEKENINQTNRKGIIANRLSKLIDIFFPEKYDYDEENSTITFYDSDEKINGHILSDGEKNIIAFCYYIVDTYVKIGNTDDLNKLLFVIDDPVSSMDYNHIYSIADIIKRIPDIIKQDLGISNYSSSYIVLTHNLNFFNYLISAKNFGKSYTIFGNNICQNKDNVIAPYISHLTDIYVASIDIQKITYTIPNSIRQVIETLMTFEWQSYSDARSYIDSNSEYFGGAPVYQIMEDLSHGRYRTGMVMSQSDIHKCCCSIIDYVCIKYPRHIEYIEKGLASHS